MIIDLEQRIEALCDSLEAQKQEYEQATTFVAEAMYGISQRIERIEQWLLEQKK